MPARVKKRPVDPAKLRWIDELKDAHKGQMGFVLGNGWSMSYYDANKMKEDGVLFGCNECYTRFQLDYLTWQDSKVHHGCSGFDGVKLVPRRKGFDSMLIDDDKAYFFGFGRLNKANPNTIRLMHSGGMALQLAIRLGCDPIILVGCDCRLFDMTEEDEAAYEYKSNIFKKGDRKDRVKKEYLIYHGDKITTKQLDGFAKKFELIYDHFKEKCRIYQLGDWSIMDKIPSIEWEEYWSDEHPRRTR